MEEKIAKIKDWLGTGSIDIFGLPMSGKDTVGIKLAEMLGARFLSSGMIIRAMEKETDKHYTDGGSLAPTDIFYEWVLPYFGREDLANTALILSSVGRWEGEEDKVMEAARDAGHPIKAAALLNVSEADIEERWKTVRETGLRESQMPVSKRVDDQEHDVFKKRIDEFNKKTMPVLRHYQDLGMLVPVRADMTREEVLDATIDALYDFARKEN